MLNRLLLVLMVTLLPGCKEQSLLLAKQDVINLTVNEAHGAGGKRRVTVSGLAAHSALAVERIEQVEQPAGSVALRVYLSPAGAGRTGQFSYTLTVPDTIKQITFGPARDVIWSRSDP
ncbi:hypothetical protein [Intestinirhabdus alba]|uniref:Uncharacterized protein n=1 Tax=Intestinirhabdus alba TaxID=2899544 RepID=A0A6L6IKL0_9ENTR|nr:hypothetical protein [Intestinirhabdus alba]MTH46427.1 hypothetical protein [Intestinirhabdus alba]